MNWVEILTNSGVILTIIGSNFAMFFWSRSESRSDMRHMDQKIDDLIGEIQKETKDFHGRLCSLEARVK